MDQKPSSIARRQARALRLITCLRSGPGFSANELAEHLCVSRRTIFRDLNLVREAGVPVHFDKEHDAYRLSAPAGCVTLPRFCEEDLARLIVAAHLSPLRNFQHFSVSLRDSIAKLLAAYPYRVSVSISRLLNACELESSPNLLSPGSSEVLTAILDAIRQRTKIRITVRCDEGVAQTKLAPYRVVASLHQWEVVGRSSFHCSTRSFTVRDIQNVERTDDRYGVPRGFRFRR